RAGRRAAQGGQGGDRGGGRRSHDELTRSGRAALELLKPTQTWVICSMEDAGYEIAPGVSVCGIDEALRKAQESA
ncbi:MAG: hypothetical protein ACOYOU_21565, partial [Kiritimatiellia bacterium]